MKYRQGYVSNSSSSSFIVVGVGEMIFPEWKYRKISVPGSFGGHTEFNGTDGEHEDFASKLNFAYLQARYNTYRKDPLLLKALEAVEGSWLLTLETVLKERLDIDEIEWSLNPDDYDGYIDHSSCAYEGENYEMYESKESLERWLFSSDSYISESRDG